MLLKWGFLAASIAMVIGTLVFQFLKDRYVKTPDGKPLGGLPKHNDASLYEEGEAQKAEFSTQSLNYGCGSIFCIIFLF